MVWFGLVRFGPVRFGSVRFGSVPFDLSALFQLDGIGWLVDFRARASVSGRFLSVYLVLLRRTWYQVLILTDGWFHFVGKFKFCIANRLDVSTSTFFS